MEIKTNIWTRILYIIALLSCFTGLGFYIATAAGASSIFLEIGIWLIFGAVIIAIIARSISGGKITD